MWREGSDPLPGRSVPLCHHRHRLHHEAQHPQAKRHLPLRQEQAAHHSTELQLHGTTTGARNAVGRRSAAPRSQQPATPTALMTLCTTVSCRAWSFCPMFGEGVLAFERNVRWPQDNLERDRGEMGLKIHPETAPVSQSYLCQTKELSGRKREYTVLDCEPSGSKCHMYQRF